MAVPKRMAYCARAKPPWRGVAGRWQVFRAAGGWQRLPGVANGAAAGARAHCLPPGELRAKRAGANHAGAHYAQAGRAGGLPLARTRGATRRGGDMISDNVDAGDTARLTLIKQHRLLRAFSKTRRPASPGMAHTIFYQTGRAGCAEGGKGRTVRCGISPPAAVSRRRNSLILREPEKHILTRAYKTPQRQRKWAPYLPSHGHRVAFLPAYATRRDVKSGGAFCHTVLLPF